jgi:putative heme iron utilization protein
MVEFKNDNPEIVNTQTEPEIIAENPLGTTSFSASRDISAETGSFTTIVSSNGELSFHIEAGPESSGSISLNLSDVKLGGTKAENILASARINHPFEDGKSQSAGMPLATTSKFVINDNSNVTSHTLVA